MNRREKKFKGRFGESAAQNQRRRRRRRKLASARGGRLFFKTVLALTAVLALASALALSVTTSAQNKESSCVTCHSRLTGRWSEPVHLFENDIHRSRGLSCHDCHGGDPTQEEMKAAKDPSKGYLGKPKTGEIPLFCGKCHSDAALMKRFNPALRVDQVQEYFTSIHGARLKGGDDKVATCVSCHNVHGIRPASDPLSSIHPLKVAETCGKCHGDASRMQGYQIPHDQYDKYKRSVHAAALYEKHDLSAPTCNDCHGNHGAVPPGLDSVANICGQCHARQSALFKDSPHKGAFDKLRIGECLRCHSNHEILPPTDQMVGTGQGSVCTSCHAGDKGFAAAERIGGRIGELRTGIEHATDILDRAERAGMEVSRPKFELRDASDGLTQARVLVHTSSADKVEEAVEPAMAIAAKSYQNGEAAFAELSYRRQGLAISLVFIFFLAALVYLKVRQIESKDAQDIEPQV